MKTIGLLGGMSWESTELYYRWINAETKRLRGGLHSAPIAMVSVGFQEIETLEQRGLKVRIPYEEDREIVHRIIYEELCLGQIHDSSRQKFLRIIDQLYTSGAQGVIEGCTEIVMLVQQEHTRVPLFDTTAIHARQAVDEALK